LKVGRTKDNLGFGSRLFGERNARVFGNSESVKM
jgi:hypothetical protein